MNPDELDIPDAGEYLWDWFEELCGCVRHIVDGAPVPITWTEYLAWASATGNIVNSEEYAILRDMDAAWRVAMAEELADTRAQMEAEAKAEANQPKRGRTR